MITEEWKDFVRRRSLEKIVFPAGSPSAGAASSQDFSSGFSLEDSADFWRVNGVNYRNGLWKVDLGKDLLENKAQKTQDEWIEYTKKALTNDGFYAGDAQLHHALFKAFFKNKDNVQYKAAIEQARIFLQSMFKDYWLVTLSRVGYAKQGNDLVTHNYGLQDKFEVQENMIGADGYVTQINPQTALQAVLRDDNINEINQVYNWITGKNLYLWRLNAKPQEDTERVVGFDSNSVRVILYCSRDLDVLDRALAVRAKKF